MAITPAVLWIIKVMKELVELCQEIDHADMFLYRMTAVV